MESEQHKNNDFSSKAEFAEIENLNKKFLDMIFAPFTDSYIRKAVASIYTFFEDGTSETAAVTKAAKAVVNLVGMDSSEAHVLRRWLIEKGKLDAGGIVQTLYGVESPEGAEFIYWLEEYIGKEINIRKIPTQEEYLENGKGAMEGIARVYRATRAKKQFIEAEYVV